MAVLPTGTVTFLLTDVEGSVRHDDVTERRSMKPVRTERLGVAIIGAGRIAEIHARAYQGVPDRARILCVVDVQVERATARALEWGVDHYCTDILDAVRRPDVHAVDICVPHHVRGELVRVACDHGKHVLLEKPIAVSEDEAKTIIDAARDADVVLMVAHNLLFHAAVERAKELIAEGVIGDVTLMKAQSLGWFFFTSDDFRRSVRQTGGGVLMDTGMHFVYVAQDLLGPIQSVMASHGSVGRDEMEGEDTALLQCEFQSGVLGEVVLSYGAKLPGWTRGFPTAWSQVIELYGTGGVLYISLPDCVLRVFSVAGHRPADREHWAILSQEPRAVGPNHTSDLRGYGSDTGGGSTDEGWIEMRSDRDYFDSYRAEVAHFVDAALAGKNPRVTGNDGLAALRVVLAGYESMRTGSRIPV
jgi:predicted dehydrogenase